MYSILLGCFFLYLTDAFFCICLCSGNLCSFFAAVESMASIHRGKNQIV